MAETKDLTERELNIMAMAWLCFAEQPKPDYEKLAALTDFTNPKSVANAWSLIKKKLAYKASTAGAQGGKPAATTPKPTPRKRGRKAEGEDVRTPTKKTKLYTSKSPATISQQEKEEDDEDEDDEEERTVIKAEQDEDENEEEAAEEV